MLDCTSGEIKERSGGLINPARTCQPLGAMYAALGIHGCLPHSHGSQGCCSYHRSHLTRHFREPVMASTSSFTEGASVFGGGANLKAAIKNVFEIYNPEVMAIHTTCLSETIGDDIPTIIKSTEIPPGKVVIHANTPSYQGSHITGFANMVKAMVNYLCAADEDSLGGMINILPGFVNPADMREMRRLAEIMGARVNLFPDTSGVLDAPMTGSYQMFPPGGARVSQIRQAGRAEATLALGTYASGDPALQLKRKCRVQPHILKLPIGIEATDAMIMLLRGLMKQEVSADLEEERGQLVDIMSDNHHIFSGRRVAVFGDPDHVLAMTEYCLSLGMRPVHVLTGTPSSLPGSPGGGFETEIARLWARYGMEGNCRAGGDLFLLHQWIKREPVDLLIGNTYGKFIARAENMAFVRFGFPVLDRICHTYQPVVGYRGAIRLAEMISNALLDRQDQDAADEDLELVM